jgi:hypothetical protein
MTGLKRNRDEDRDDDRLQGHGDGGGANGIATEAIERHDADGPSTKRSKTNTVLQARSAGTAEHRSSHVASTNPSPSFGTDCVSLLSDELLIRILGNLPMVDLLSLAPVSRRFHRLADDSQLWKAIYYERFVLPRAMRIPGFRGGSLTSPKAITGAKTGTATQVPSQGLQGSTPGCSVGAENGSARPLPSTQDGWQVNTAAGPSRFTSSRRRVAPSWKQQFKLRHNWARGKCAVEELRLSHSSVGHDGLPAPSRPGRDGDDTDGDDEGDASSFHRMLVKVIDGIAVTADRKRGLRVWELKSRSMVARGDFSRWNNSTTAMEKSSKAAGGSISNEHNADGSRGEVSSDDRDDATSLTPRSLAVDAGANVLDIAVGLLNGGFEVWQHDLTLKTLVRRFSHAALSSGPLAGIAYSHPYVLTATDSGLISLYVFGSERRQKAAHQLIGSSKVFGDMELCAPHLLTSLRSHTSQPPLALSIRQLTSVTIASIAYTFSTRQGWSIGIQDLHVKADGSAEGNEKGAGGLSLPTVVATRLANTVPITVNVQPRSSVHPATRRADMPSSSLPRPEVQYDNSVEVAPAVALHVPSPRERSMRQQGQAGYEDGVDGGPTTLCYTHPYLLATMPDNTLILHLCTSNASTLAISAGIRLWGHTSGISDAEITARGKAVSVSIRGEEMRVWELEGRPAAERGQSVAIRPNTSDTDASSSDSGYDSRGLSTYDWDERRNWVGFDDEMVIVLKESRGGRESLLMYDFT